MTASESRHLNTDYVDTTAGGEHEPGAPSAGNATGSGANPITRAGLPNADPDGFDDQGSDANGVTRDESALAGSSEVGSTRARGAVTDTPTYPDETRQRNAVAAPTAPTASHDAERSTWSGPEQVTYRDGDSNEREFAGKSRARLIDEEQEVIQSTSGETRRKNPPR